MALAIGRREGESVNTTCPGGQVVTVEVVMVLGAKVLLGVTAPPHWRIERPRDLGRHESPRRRPPN